MTDRTQGIIDRLAGAESYDDIKWILKSGVLTNYTESVVDAKIKANYEFQGRAGLYAQVDRVTVGKTCRWCRDLAGTYVYPDVPPDVWRRHDNCNCVIRYTSRAGRVDILEGDTGHGWDIVESSNPEEIQRRKNYTGAGTTSETRKTLQEKLMGMNYQNMRDAENGIHTIGGERLIRAQAGYAKEIPARIQTALEQNADGMLIYTDRELTQKQLEELREMVAAELGDVEHFVVRIWGKGIDGTQVLYEV